MWFSEDISARLEKAISKRHLLKCVPRDLKNGMILGKLYKKVTITRWTIYTIFDHYIIAFDDLAANLAKNGPLSENPYVMGKTFSYGDITIGAVLYTLATSYPNEWENIRKWNDGRWALLSIKCSTLVTETWLGHSCNTK